jgi:hypothetical protein
MLGIKDEFVGKVLVKNFGNRRMESSTQRCLYKSGFLLTLNRNLGK